MGLGDKRELYTGANDALARAMQLVIVPMLFGLAGYGLDRWLGTAPVLMLVLFLLGLIGCCLSIYFAYKLRMDALEESAPWKRGLT